MPRPASDSAITVLRSALAGPYPAVRDAARAVISRALLQPTLGAACEELGVSRRAFERLRADFPGIDTRPAKGS